MRNWKAMVRLSNGSVQEIRVKADTYSNAKAMIDAQYGKGAIRSGPTPA